MSTLHTGMLTERVELQSRAAGVDARGQASGTWATVAVVLARVRPLRSRELFAAGQINAMIDAEITIRWRDDVANTWRVIWRGLAYDIVGAPIAVDGGREWMQLLVSSGMRDAL